jgi:arsenate reductase-like glutaredoxin family protein
MALKKKPDENQEQAVDSSISGQKAKELFSQNKRQPKKENKVLTTFSIEPSFKRELEELFSSMGLGWAAGIRFSLKEFQRKYESQLQ